MGVFNVGQIMVDSGLFILIWLVQLIIYPSMKYTEEKAFVAWHARYTALISIIVCPLMLLQAGMEIMTGIVWDPRWMRILLIVFVWISTFFMSVPCHSRLHANGKDMKIIERLITTNWPRTALWTLLFLETVKSSLGAL